MPTRGSGTQGVETFSLDVKRVSLWSMWRMGRKTGQKVKIELQIKSSSTMLSLS